MGRQPVSLGFGVLCFLFIMVITSLTVSEMQSVTASSDDNVLEGTNIIPSTQQQVPFPRYENPTLGISVQHPSDWLLVGESDDKLNFKKDAATVEIDVDDLDPSDTLSDHANERVDDLREDRDDFELIEFEPITISNGQPAQKAVYSFTGEDGEVINVIRVWSVYQGKLYSIAYIADSNQYDQYLPIAQEMIDSFEIVGAKQIGSGDQSLSLPELKPQTTGNSESPAISEPETPPVTGDFVMKVRLEPHENEFARQEGRYQVSDFAIATTNSSKLSRNLCPVSNCEFDLDGEMSGEDTPAERALDGKLRIETGDSTKIMDLYANLQMIEERQQVGENVQVVQGELITSLGDINRPNYQSLINGTLVPDGDDFTLELIGTGESPFIYG
jgi:PsbP-like protein